MMQPTLTVVHVKLIYLLEDLHVYIRMRMYVFMAVR